MNFILHRNERPRCGMLVNKKNNFRVRVPPVTQKSPQYTVDLPNRLGIPAQRTTRPYRYIPISDMQMQDFVGECLVKHILTSNFLCVNTFFDNISQFCRLHHAPSRITQAKQKSWSVLQHATSFFGRSAQHAICASKSMLRNAALGRAHGYFRHSQSIRVGHVLTHGVST